MTSLQRAAWSHAPGGVQLSATGENALYHCIIHSYLVPSYKTYDISHDRTEKGILSVSRHKYKHVLKTKIILQNQFVVKQNQQNVIN